MAVTPVFLQSNLSDLFGVNSLPVLEELFRTSFDLFPKAHEMLFKVVAHDREIWQSSELHDLPQFSVVPEGAEYTFQRQKQGASKTFTIQKFGLGVSISEEMVEDGKFDHIQMLISELGRSAAESREIKAMNVFNNGFSSETTSDGQPVFDQAHTLPSGLTFRNELATAADLDVTSLTTAISDYETEFISDNGKQLMLRKKTLLVHPDNRLLAKELLQSNLKPETADNNMNSFMDEGMSVVSSPHLTDADAWFILSMPQDTGLRVISRSPVETKAGGPDVGFSTDAILYKSRYRWQVGAIHPYGAFGSPGV